MNDVKEVFEKIAKVIKKSGIEIPKNYKIEVENIVASVKFDSKINLDTIAFNLENSEYEPEQFPGLVYRMDQPKVALLFFSSGKVICTGGRNIKDIKVAIEKIYSKLKSIKAFVK
jgi:transcription initiation factor TFIID TATA-box-binding protein